MTQTAQVQTVTPVWWQHGVVYQIYPRSFRDTNADGTGDLAGVIEHLDYLTDTLGVDAIWLSPFFPSPMADFGYDISNYVDVDPLFGNLATFDRLIAAAHARDLCVIIDYVPNHTSDQHPWFTASRAARTDPYRDWYVWADPKPDGSPPNNWLSIFGGSAWEFDAPTGQYYLHSFLKQQPDLNWRNPRVKAAMLDVLRFWLERGVDGFRIDALPCIMKDPELRDNPPNLEARSGRRAMGEYDSQLHVNDKEHPELHAVLRELRQLLESFSGDGRPRIAIGEVHVTDLGEWSRYYGELDELHLPFNFRLIAADWEAGVVRDIVDAIESAVPEGAWPNYVLSNHDEPRLASRIGPRFARVAMLLLLTLRGTPTLYYGEELGMQDVPIPPEQVQDPFGLRVPGFGLGRDPSRTPMQWDTTPHAGFCAADCAPWLPVSADAASVNVAEQLAEPASMLTLTRRLLALRRETEALHAGAYTALHGVGVPEDCLVYVREGGGRRLLVALNFAAEPRVVRLPEAGRGNVLLSTRLDREGVSDLAELPLRAAEGWIVELSSARSGP